MSWLYSRVLVEAYLGENFSDGEPSVPLSGNHTQLAYLPPDKMTDFSRLSRFGMMFKPLTENLGTELLTLYLEDFHAKTSPQQEKAQELTENDQECGKRWHGLLAKYDQDLCLWKTPQCSLLEDSEPSLEIWPRWGSMQSGASFLRPIPALRTSENESGLWLTPRVVEIDESPENFRKRMNSKRKNDRKNGFGSLTMQVKAKEQMWPTPRNRDYKDGKTIPPSRELNPEQATLGQKVIMEGSTGGTLNPTWVEWLMGWPLGWTDLKPLEMDKFQEWQQHHGKF